MQVSWNLEAYMCHGESLVEFQKKKKKRKKQISNESGRTEDASLRF